MSPRKISIIAGSVVLLAVGAQVGFLAWRGPLAGVLIVNEGSEPIERLVASTARDESAIARIEAGASARVHLRGGRNDVLKLGFRQKGNALKGLEVAGFDPPMLSREGFILVVRIQTNAFERYQEEDEPGLLSRIWTRFRRWLDDALESN